MGNFISKENVTREVYAYQLLSYSKQTNTQLTTGKDNWVYVASVINDLKLSNTEKLSMFLQFALKDRRITPVKELLEIFKYALSKTSNSSYFDYFTTMGEVISYFGPKPSSRDTFWIETGFGSRRSLDIQPSSVVKILSSKDFYRYSNKGLPIVLREVNGVIKEYEEHSVRDFLKKYITDLPDNALKGFSKESLSDLLTNKGSSLFDKNTFGSLSYYDKPIHWDTKNSVYVYFQNGVVEITRKGIKLLPYSSLNGAIWESQVIKFEIDLGKRAKKSDFEKFMFNVAGKNDSRFLSLKACLGYLCSRYKDPAKVKAIILMDDIHQNVKGANGGRGKNLLFNAVAELRKAIPIDGRNYSFSDFSFQMVNNDTNVILYHDVPDDFHFPSLFSAITEDLIINKKHKQAYAVPFQQSPKIAISSNFNLQKVNDISERRRQFIFKLSDHYGEFHTPEKEFGKGFFKDWNTSEWNSFYLLMFSCIQDFLKNGLINLPADVEKEMELSSRTNKRFLTFIHKHPLQKEKIYDVISLRKQFEKFTGGENTINPRDFKNWLSAYLEVNKITTEEKRRTGKNYFHKSNGRWAFKIA